MLSGTGIERNRVIETEDHSLSSDSTTSMPSSQQESPPSKQSDAPRPTPSSASPDSGNWWLELEAYVERMFILFSIYSLSIGPMYWHYIDARQGNGNTLLAAFYEPLRLLGELFPLFGKCLNWYVSLWVG